MKSGPARGPTMDKARGFFSKGFVNHPHFQNKRSNIPSNVEKDEDCSNFRSNPGSDRQTSVGGGPAQGLVNLCTLPNLFHMLRAKSLQIL